MVRFVPMQSDFLERIVAIYPFHLRDGDRGSIMKVWTHIALVVRHNVETVLEFCCAFALSEVPEYRKRAVKSIGVLVSQFEGLGCVQSCFEAVFSAMIDTGTEFGDAVTEATVALAKIMVKYPEFAQGEIIGEWIRRLPMRDHKHALVVHSILGQFVLNNIALFFSVENASVTLRVMAKICHHGLADDQTRENLKLCLTWSDFSECVAALKPSHQLALSELLTSAEIGQREAA
jgi:hypothetical protein